MVSAGECQEVVKGPILPITRQGSHSVSIKPETASSHKHSFGGYFEPI